MKIVASHLSKRFTREWIFRDFTQEFNTGITYALVGPNGCGKSTLLQILWGQMIPSTGSIQYVNEKGNISEFDIFKNISIATPYMDLIDEFTLEEMVDFHFRFKPIRGLLSTEEIMEKIELQHARSKLISNFSSGMRQRLKLALAFFTQSACLFLDEPTTNLDRKSIDWYWENLNPILTQTITIIASNQEAEYPAHSQKINILSYK
jgi:ABC-type multidrug transport system ATPase subunit